MTPQVTYRCYVPLEDSDFELDADDDDPETQPATQTENTLRKIVTRRDSKAQEKAQSLLARRNGTKKVAYSRAPATMAAPLELLP